MSLTQSVISVMSYQAENLLGFHAEQAYYKSGLSVPPEVAAWRSMGSYQGATYIGSFSLVGDVEQPMYDEHPYDVTFVAARVVDRHLHPSTLAMVKASLKYPDLLDLWNAEVQSSGWNCLKRLDLYDCFDNLVASAELGNEGVICWDDPVQADEEQLEQWQKQARQLLEQAALEGGWDNYCTAEGLREHSRRLQRLVSMARNSSRLAS